MSAVYNASMLIYVRIPPHREAQSSIFGARTMKERRLDEQRIIQVDLVCACAQ